MEEKMITRNLSKEKRDRLVAKIEEIKTAVDEEAVAVLNEVENEIKSKKYGLLWEDHSEEVEDQMRTKIPVFTEDATREIALTDEGYNFILEGDNLHSLKLLEKTHKGKIDVIYIDPPYNTGAKNWKYNNNYVDANDYFRHSKWIAMMERRLSIARSLLKDTGVLICAIDENEIASLKLLLEDLFGYSYTVDVITVIQNPRGIQGDNFSYTNEYALFVYRKGYKVIGEKEVEEEEIDWNPFRNWGSESERSDAKNCFYGILTDGDKIIGFDDVLDNDIHPHKNEKNERGEVVIYPIDSKGVERKWRYARQSAESILPILRIKETKGSYDVEIGKPFAPYKTVWTDKKYDANEYGTQLINSMVPNNDFDFPKSIWNVYECLFATTKNNPNAIILDFFAGSGTTGHATELLNRMIGGSRKYILATNNALGEEREKEFKKKYGNPEEDPSHFAEYLEAYGICTSITFPRIKAVAEGYTHTKDVKYPLLDKKMNKTLLSKIDDVKEEIDTLTEANKEKYDDIKLVFEDNHIILQGVMKKGNTVEGIPHNVKYYKTEFVNKKRDGSVPKALLRHVKELIQLEMHCKVDNKTICIAFTEEEFDSILEKHLDDCEILFVASDVLLTSSQKRIIDDSRIELIDIPEYYFSQELREVDEV